MADQGDPAAWLLCHKGWVTTEARVAAQWRASGYPVDALVRAPGAVAAAVLAIHQRHPSRPVCTVCVSDDGREETYPCPTAAVVTMTEETR